MLGPPLPKPLGALLLLLLLSVNQCSGCISRPRPPTTPRPPPTTTTTARTTTRAPSRLGNATRCGHKGRERIVGGETTADGEIPWQCSLLQGRDRWIGCGAVLISCSPTIVLSAAHCFRGDISNLVVSCGTNIRSLTGNDRLTEHEQRRSVRSVVKHPRYSSATNRNDIALLKVNGDFDCVERRLYPACLPTRRETYAGWERGLVTGWGRTSENGGPLSTTLLKAKVPIVSDRDCNNAYNGAIDSASMICAGKEGIDACQGDSGGPLVAQDNEHLGWALVGVVSWGIGCARKGLFGVYAEVSQYLPWIASHFDLLPPSGYSRWKPKRKSLKRDKEKKKRRKGEERQK